MILPKIATFFLKDTVTSGYASPETTSTTNEDPNLPTSQDEQPKEQPVTINIPMVTPIDRTMQEEEGSNEVFK